MTDTCGDGLGCQYDTGEFKMTEPVAIKSSSGKLQEVVWESIDVVGRILAPPSITGWILRTVSTRMRRGVRYRVSRLVLLLPL
jgi:hypothetical protein